MGSRLAKYVKTPIERKRYQIDYTDWLDTGESVVSVGFTVGQVTVPPLVFDDVQVLPSAKGIQYYISGGLDGQTYEVEALLTTSTGPQVRDDEIIVVVRDQ